jgi:energy-coupling factor transporter ATP-binding protein EcfA2
MPQPCFSTGLPSLDDLIGEHCPGIPRGGLTIIVGNTGSGKSSLCRKIASNVATQHTIETAAFRVGFADIEGMPDHASRPYNILSLSNLSDLAQTLVRSRFELLIVDGVQYLESDRPHQDPIPFPELDHSRQLDSILTRVANPHLALVITWQENLRSSVDRRSIEPTHSIPAGLVHRANLILQVEGSNLIRVAKNRFGVPGSFAEFGPRWRDVPKVTPEPEFDRSVIKTRFEREDVI